MSASFSERLPPSSRDLEIYRLVSVEKLSLRQAAVQMLLSTTRIRQIVQKVGDYLGQQLLGSPQQPLAEKLVVAEFVASERVNHLYGEALRGWEASQKNKESLRRMTSKAKGEVLIETMQSTPGSVQFLNAAFRYSLAAAKFPMPRLALMGGDDEEELSAEEAYVKEAAAMSDVEVDEQNDDVPPVGDCAPEPEKAFQNQPKTLAENDLQPFDGEAISPARRAASPPRTTLPAGRAGEDFEPNVGASRLCVT